MYPQYDFPTIVTEYLAMFKQQFISLPLHFLIVGKQQISMSTLHEHTVPGAKPRVSALKDYSANHLSPILF